MRLLYFCLALALGVSSALSADETSTGNGIDWTVGILYDQLSQDYYLSQIDTLAIDEDSLLTLRKISDETEVPRIKFRFNWAPSIADKRYFNLNNVTFMSDEDLRNNLVLELDYGSLDISNETQIRAIIDQEKTSNTGYVSNLLTARLKPSISRGLFFVSRNSFEVVRFDGTDDFNYDYDYIKNYIGLEKEFGLLDYAAFGYRLDNRIVGDSSRLDLTRHRLVAELSWSPSLLIAIDVQNEFSRILSAKENDLDDSWEEYLESTISLYPGADWTLRIRDKFEYTVFDTQDVVNFDYIYNTAELQISKQPSSSTEVFLRPSIVTYWSVSEEYESYDYNQVALEYGVDLYPGDWLWLSASHKIGQRDYGGETDVYYTDYTLNRLNLYADVGILQNLRLNTIVSIDWENHETDEDDNVLTMMTVGLDFMF